MDRLRLEYEIKKNGLTIDGFCKAIGISRSAYYRKCNGISEFTHGEIQKTMEVLKLESPIEIFFTNKVSQKTH